MSSPKGKKEKKRETIARPVLSINPEGSLSSVDDDCTSPKKTLPGEGVVGQSWLNNDGVYIWAFIYYQVSYMYTYTSAFLYTFLNER